MKAIVVHEPGGPEVLTLEERPIPTAAPGWIVVKVDAFGLNRSELETRAGGSGDAVKFPRVLGIECVGTVADPSDSDLSTGQRVVAAMGGMGRDFDGGYQQFALLPIASVIPVETTLPPPELGAIPESFGTAWGTLELLDLTAGQSLLVHGATSSVGMAAVVMAKDRGLRVIGTTRQETKRAALEQAGVDDVIVADGDVAHAVRDIIRTGVDGLCELVGPSGFIDAVRAVSPGGAGCVTGFLEHDWDTTRAASEAERAGVRFHRYGSSVIDRDSYGEVFQVIVAAIEAGRYGVNLDRTFSMEEITDAHTYMEANRAAGKVVVLAD